jgi:hypothetical protein
MQNNKYLNCHSAFYYLQLKYNAILNKCKFYVDVREVKRVSDVPALYHPGPTIPAPIWNITGRTGRVSFPAPIFENPSGPIFETIPFDEIAEII